MRAEGGNGWEMRLGRWQDSPVGLCDHVISDPPFTDHVSQNQRRGNAIGQELELSFGGIDPAELEGVVRASSRWCILFCAVEQLGFYQAAFPDEYVRGGVWVKTNPTPQQSGDRPAMWGEGIAILHSPGSRKRWNGRPTKGRIRGDHVSGATGRGMPAIWTFGTENGRTGERFHETQKPVDLMRALVEEFTDVDEVVWDPFAGSATTGVACIQTGRQFIGHELQEHYFEQAVERLRAAKRGQTLSSYQAGQEVLF